MKKVALITLCAGLWLSPLASAGWSQEGSSAGDGPPGGGPRFGEGPRGPERGRRNGGRGQGEKGELTRLWRGIGRLDSGGDALSKSQSKRLVALVLPWSKKPAMTQVQAKALRLKLEATLTGAQKTALADGPRGFGGPRDSDGPRGAGDRPGPPGGFGGDDGPPRDREGGPRGQGGPGRAGFGRGLGGMNLSAEQRQFMRSWLDNSNPFYAPTGTTGWKKLPSMFQKDVARRYKENRAMLEMLSRQSR